MRLLLDEMHTPTVADTLLRSGFDVVAVAATPALRGLPDSDLLHHGAVESRALVTENISDFSRLVMHWHSIGVPHAGVVFTNRWRFHRASRAYPGNLITALTVFLEDPPVTGESWVWWL